MCFNRIAGTKKATNNLIRKVVKLFLLINFFLILVKIVSKYKVIKLECHNDFGGHVM